MTGRIMVWFDEPRKMPDGSISPSSVLREVTPSEILSAALSLDDVELEWYCEAWELRRGVSEPCEAGSTHDAPDFNCHWRAVFTLLAQDDLEFS